MFFGYAYTNSVNYTLFTCINKMRIYGSENRESSKPGSSSLDSTNKSR